MSYVNDGEQYVYWQKDYMSEDGAFWTIATLSFIGIVYSLIMVFALGLQNDVKQEVEKKQQEKQEIDENRRNRSRNPYNNFEGGGEQRAEHDHFLEKIADGDFYKICENIHKGMMQIYLTQSLYMVFFGIILICCTAYWFMPTVKSALVSILAFCMGILIGAMCAFCVMKFTVCASPKVIISLEDEVSNPVRYIFVVGSVIATLCLATMILVYFMMLIISRNEWNDGEDGEDRPLTEKQYQNMAHALASYGVGIAFACLFYREAAGQSAKGVIVGYELVGRDDHTFHEETPYLSQFGGRYNNEQNEESVIKKNMAMAALISNNIVTNLIPIMDTLSIVSSLLCLILILFSKVESFRDGKYYGLYGAGWFFAISIPISWGMAWIANTEVIKYERQDADFVQKTISSVAMSVMLQLIIVNAVMLLIILVLPRFVFPRTFKVGDIDEQDIWASKRIYHGDIVWCLSLGLILQTILLCFGEFFTSHNFFPTRNTANDIKKNSSIGFMTSYIFINNAHFFIFIFIGFVILLTYVIAGFPGMALCGIGVICTPVTLLSINFLSGISQTTQELSRITLYQDEKVLKLLNWPAKNYTIHTQIINMTALFFTNFTALGCTLIISDIQAINIWQGFSLFGFLFGGGVCYLLRAGSVSTCKALCDKLESAKDQTHDLNEDITALNNRTINRTDKFPQFVQELYDQGIMRVGIQIAILILTIILFGLLFGAKCLIGYLLGLNLVGLNMMIQQILMGNSIKSAIDFNNNGEKSGQLTDEQKQQTNNKNAFLYSMAIEQYPSSSLISYLTFSTLFIVLGVLAFAESGYLKDAIEESASYFPARTTQWVDDVQYGIESATEQASALTGGEPEPVPDYDTSQENPTQEEVGEGNSVEDAQEDLQSRAADTPPESADNSNNNEGDTNNDESGGDNADGGGDGNADGGGDGNADGGGDGNADGGQALFLQLNNKKNYYY